MSWKSIEQSILIHAQSIKLTEKDLPKFRHDPDRCEFCLKNHISKTRLKELQNEETSSHALAQIKKAIY